MRKETKTLSVKIENDEIEFPVGIIQGDQPGPTVCITAGIHGCEYSGIVAAIKLLKLLQPEQLKGTVKIMTISNIPSFEERSMFVTPVDKINPNRVYPGKENGSYTEKLVHYQLNDFIDGSDFYIDLHGGDMVEALVPFSIYHQSGNEKVDDASQKLAEVFGIPNIIATTLNGEWPDSGTSYANASERGIPAIIAEAGGIGQLYEKDVDILLMGLMNVLKHVGCIEGEPEYNHDITYFDRFIWIRSKSNGIFYKKNEVGDLVKVNDSLGVVEDYFGYQVENVVSLVEGKILFLTTSPAIKEDGLLMGIAVKR